METRKPNLTCPCCGYVVITDEFDVCPICRWEYNYYQHDNIDDDGGPNQVSLRAAQMRFMNKEPIETGIKGREPYPDEHRDPDWRTIR